MQVDDEIEQRNRNEVPRQQNDQPMHVDDEVEHQICEDHPQQQQEHIPHQQNGIDDDEYLDVEYLDEDFVQQIEAQVYIPPIFPGVLVNIAVNDVFDPIFGNLTNSMLMISQGNAQTVEYFRLKLLNAIKALQENFPADSTPQELEVF